MSDRWIRDKKQPSPDLVRARRSEPHQRRSPVATVHVPSRYAGRIIGRGGATIRQLQQDSGADVSVGQPGGNGTTPVLLWGSKKAVKDATHRINLLVQDQPHRTIQRTETPPQPTPPPTPEHNSDSTIDWSSASNEYCKEQEEREENLTPVKDFYKEDTAVAPLTPSEPVQVIVVKLDLTVVHTIKEEVVMVEDDDKNALCASLLTNIADKELQPTPPLTPEDNNPIDWGAAWKEYCKQQEERDASLTTIVKDFYKEDPAVAALTPSQANRQRRINMNIRVNGIEADVLPVDVPNPVATFEQCFKHYPEIMSEIRKQKFKTPTPIQSQAWPILMKGRDMIGIAQTGTGKTLAFLLPALIHIDGQPTPRSERRGPNVLVMAPTRELALQIEKEVNKYDYKNIKAITVCGGKSRKDQIQAIGEGVQIVIATPGRLNDLIDAGYLAIETITYLVFDEADRMLFMGFEPEIRRALIDVRSDRQTVMTSATWPSGVRRLAKKFLNNPLQVVVGTLDLTAVHTVKQEVIMVKDDEKYALCAAFLTNITDKEKVIVFCRNRAIAAWLSSELAINYYRFMRTQCIYSSLEQCDREKAIEDMQTNVVNILIATDIASRGLDIDDVTHVVNYDFPEDITEYVHRIGRTGRAGKSGTSISYFTKNDWSKAGELVKILKKADQIVPLELEEMSEQFEKMVVSKKRQTQMKKRGRKLNRGGQDQTFDFY